MTALIFLLTALTLIVLLIRVCIKLIRRKPARGTLTLGGAIVLAYGLAWTFSDLTRKMVPVPLNTEICFDDWCATVVNAEKRSAGDSSQVIVHIKMSNHARGIAQKPSEPRVHILDGNGATWAWSANGQLAYEKQNGKQPGIDHRLELHESMETALVFTIPKNAGSLKVLIEDGPPFITGLIFPEDEKVFPVQ